MKSWTARIIHAAMWAGAYFSLLWWVPATRAIGFGFDWWLGVILFHAIAIISIVALFFLVMLLGCSAIMEDEYENTD